MYLPLVTLAICTLEACYRSVRRVVNDVLSKLSPCSTHPQQACYFLGEFYTQAISLITSRENQAYSATTGVEATLCNWPILIYNKLLLSILNCLQSMVCFQATMLIKSWKITICCMQCHTNLEIQEQLVFFQQGESHSHQLLQDKFLFLQYFDMIKWWLTWSY